MQDEDTGSGAGPAPEGGPESVSEEGVSQAGQETPDGLGFGPPDVTPDATSALDAAGEPGTTGVL